MFNNQTSGCLFCKKLPIYQISCSLNKAMFDILQQFLQSQLNGILHVRKTF